MVADSINDGAMTTISVNGLYKRFDEVTAVDGISFSVNRGELFGFLGPNGAGKTTTINMLTGLARPEAGTIHIGGIDCTDNPRKAQHLIGVIPDESNLYPELSGFDNLTFCASLYGMTKSKRQARARELLDTFGLSRAAYRKFGGYSKGMKRKLTIAAGIIHEPDILFLDEPTTGIDVASARQIRQLIADLHGGGTTIMLTTHYIEEAERLCERIAFIVEGRIVRIDSVSALMQPVQGKHALLLTLDTSPSDIGDSIAASLPNLEVYAAGVNTLRVESSESLSLAPIIGFLDDRGIMVTEARLLRPSLEDIFVHITGIEARAMRTEKEKKGGAA